MVFYKNIACLVFVVLLSACAQATLPDARNVDIPNPTFADARANAINERPDSVMYLPLGEDFLIPEVAAVGGLPKDKVGPFELRAETLAGALQLILAEYDISIAFETDEGLTRTVTVANLRGPLDRVIKRVCSLADLYCSYEDNILVIKETQTFTVTLPPIGANIDDTEFLDNISTGLAAILGDSGGDPIVDNTTRTIIYTATHRTAELAERYFQRLRANTALIVFETYIWEVQLNSGNSTGIDWDMVDTFGKFNASVGLDGSVGADFTSPISIGLPTTQAIGDAPSDLVQFLSQFGAVKSISQPQITVLSGSSAELRVANTENYVSEIVTTLDEGQSTTSVNTDTADSGFTLTIGSSWDKSTVYANINLEIQNTIEIEPFTFSDGTGENSVDTRIQLPRTTERDLTTQVRVRPGDSVLIAGLVQEDDNFSSEGPGFMEPILPESRTAQTENIELVILLKPRVVVYTAQDSPEFKRYATSKNQSNSRAQASEISRTPVEIPEEKEEFLPDVTPLSQPVSSRAVTRSDPEIEMRKVEDIVSETLSAEPVNTLAPISITPEQQAPSRVSNAPSFDEAYRPTARSSRVSRGAQSSTSHSNVYPNDSIDITPVQEPANLPVQSPVYGSPPLESFGASGQDGQDDDWIYETYEYYSPSN